MRILALGSNGSGQLGIGHNDDVSSPTPVQLPEGMANDDIAHICAGGNHALFLTTNGEVYATGQNDDGRCALDASDSNAETTTLQKTCLSSPPRTRIKACAATWSTSIFITADDRILTSGSGAHGELGLGPATHTALHPTEIPLAATPPSVSIVQVAASMGHAVVLLSTGAVLGWGNGQSGQLGDPTGIVWSPRLVSPAAFKATRIACGKDFTCLLSEAGEVRLLGLGKRDRFGVRGAMPRVVRGCRQMVAGWGAVYFLDGNGALVGVGRDDRGQLGPPGLPALEAVAAGSEHVVALTRGDGRIVTWGWGEHGNCGEPADGARDVKGRYNDLSVAGHAVHLGAGCATTYIVCNGKS